MIVINDKSECCGCSACAQGCPKQCITMQPDEEGFLYPQIDEDRCIDCGWCEKICPVLHRSAVPTQAPKVYGCVNKDSQVRQESSSGGLFTLLATAILRQGGVVFGARFTADWQVEHGYVEEEEELANFRGSKYLQSRIGESYQHVKEFLNHDRLVLFSGTPCQIAGLYRYLGGHFEQLYTLDIACHGVPSPEVFKRYLAELTPNPIGGITFRDKHYGWNRYSIAIKEPSGSIISHQESINNPYLCGFQKDLYLRPSCHECPTKQFTAQSDITLADYWGVEQDNPSYADNKGVNLVLLHSDKGVQLFDSISSQIDYFSSDIENALRANPVFIQSPTPHRRRSYFFAHYRQEPIIPLIKRCTKVHPLYKTYKVSRKFVCHLLRYFLNRIVGR